MPDRCSYCEQVRPVGGTDHLVLGKLWIEFCPPCGEKATVSNAETGESLTVKAKFDQLASQGG